TGNVEALYRTGRLFRSSRWLDYKAKGYYGQVCGPAIAVKGIRELFSDSFFYGSFIKMVVFAVTSPHSFEESADPALRKNTRFPRATLQLPRKQKPLPVGSSAGTALTRPTKKPCCFSRRSLAFSAA